MEDSAAAVLVTVVAAKAEEVEETGSVVEAVVVDSVQRLHIQ